MVKSADQWRAHLDRQQAAFLADVAEKFWKAIEERGGDARREHQVRSRWKDVPDFPVSSVFEFWWPVSGLAGWPKLHVWAEVFLETDADDRGLKLRSGTLLEGRKLVTAWFGLAQTAAKATFADRYWGEWHWRGSYGEVWVRSSFDLENLPALADQVVRDLLTWVETFPARLASLPGP